MNAIHTMWKTVPMLNAKKINFNLSFTEDQIINIKKGYIPKGMEDKWFIVYENEWVYFYRSWTGFEIYRAHIKKECHDKYIINDFFVEQNLERNTKDEDDNEIINFSFLILKGLLNLNVNINILTKHKKASDIWWKFGLLSIR